MRRPRRTPGQMVHSVSATDLDWERVRERADAAGMSMSRYLVRRALSVDLPRDAKGGVAPPPRLVWSADEQREMRDRIARIERRAMTGSAEQDRPALQGLHEMLWFLMFAAVLDLIRAGRTRQMTAMLVERLGEEKGTAVAENFLKVARENGLLD